MNRTTKFYCLDDKCGWSGPVPGKNKVCKRCGGPTEKKLEGKDQNGIQRLDIVTPFLDIKIKEVCPYTNLPYRDLDRDNPVIRLYEADQLHYGLIFRNRARVVHINCPNCGKLISTNAKINGQYDIVCKNMLPAEKGGGKCKAKVTIVFYREQFKETYNDKEKVEPPSAIRQGGQFQSTLQRDRITARR